MFSMATYVIVIYNYLLVCPIHNKPHDDSDKRLYNNSPL